LATTEISDNVAIIGGVFRLNVNSKNKNKGKKKRRKIGCLKDDFSLN